MNKQKYDKETEEYLAEVKKLIQKAWNWVQEHPESDAKIQFNFPGEVAVIATMEDAINKGFVTANPEGMKMLDYMGANTQGPGTPTVLMIRMAIEFLEEGMQ